MSSKKTSGELDAKELEEVLTLFFNALPDPIYVIDQTGFVIKELAGNAEVLDIFNTPLEGSNLAAILPSNLNTLFMDTITQSISNDALTCVEYEVPYSSQGQVSRQWFQGRVSPLKQRKGDIRAVLWVAINITEKKRHELELKDLAEKDGLTQLYNRRYFTDIIQRTYALYCRDKSPFCILMIDIDFFKAVNDDFGHDGGDKLLIALSNLFKESIRDIDVLARYGGEEFILLLPNSTTEGAFIVAERIRRATESFILAHGNKEISVTLSIGIGESLLNDSSYEQVIKRADTALYDAKTSGRNKVCR
jgi:diguanylate cyclase (GGDEF)-like protein/PAS domain S-box-containing protein